MVRPKLPFALALILAGLSVAPASPSTAQSQLAAQNAAQGEARGAGQKEPTTAGSFYGTVAVAFTNTAAFHDGPSHDNTRISMSFIVAKDAATDADGYRESTVAYEYENSLWTDGDPCQVPSDYRVSKGTTVAWLGQSQADFEPTASTPVMLFSREFLVPVVKTTDCYYPAGPDVSDYTIWLSLMASGEGEYPLVAPVRDETGWKLDGTGSWTEHQSFGTAGEPDFHDATQQMTWSVAMRCDDPCSKGPAPGPCVNSDPSDKDTDYRYTTVKGKSRWVMTAAPDLRLGTFDVGIRWCTSPDGHGFRGPATADGSVNTRWFLQGVLENAGFTLESKEPTVRMGSTTAEVDGRVVVKFNPVKVALNFVPVGKLLDKTGIHIDDCFRKVARGVDPGRATRELAEDLYGPVRKIKSQLRRRLQDQLDKRMTLLMAIKLSHRWSRGFDHAADAMIDYTVDQVRVGGLGLNMGRKLAGDAFEYAFGTVEYTLWRPRLKVTIKGNGKVVVKNSTDKSPGVEDEWKDKSVT